MDDFFGKIISDKSGWVLNDYFKYIDIIKDSLPQNIYEFASNKERYSIKSHASLHDSWLVSFGIKECALGSRSEKRWIDISIELLGPYHDIRFVLEYGKVSSYEIYCIDTKAGHGDLLMHEIDLVEAGLFVHRMQFSKGGKIKLIFGEFSIADISI